MIEINKKNQIKNFSLSKFKFTFIITLLITLLNINFLNCELSANETQIDIFAKNTDNQLEVSTEAQNKEKEQAEASREISDRENIPGNNWDSAWQYSEKPFFSKEILEKYAEYTILDELESSKVCNYEKYIGNYLEEFVKEKIYNNFKKENDEHCVPDSKTLVAIMENGWMGLTEYIIREIYLPKNIDPSIVVIGYINSSQSKLKSLTQVLNEFSKSKKLQIKYSYENHDDYIKMNIVFPDAGYVPENISMFCYKDSFKVSSVVKSRNKIFKLDENKKFFDEIAGNCQFSFNSFTNSIEITFDKARKLKKWEKLFL